MNSRGHHFSQNANQKFEEFLPYPLINFQGKNPSNFWLAFFEKRWPLASRIKVSPNFEITVACGVKFCWYLRTLGLTFHKTRTKIEVFLPLPGCLSVQQLLLTKYTRLPTISIYLWNFLERRKRSRWREGTAKIYFECVLLSGFLLVSLEFRTLGKLLASISKIIVFYKVYKITNHLNTSLKLSIKRKQMKRGGS